MSRMGAIAVCTMLSSAFIFTASVLAQQGAKPQPATPSRFLSRLSLTETTRDSRQVGVTVVRLINTAEMNYKRAHGSYATWDELFRSGAISEREKQGTMFQGLKLSAGPEVTPGWVLNLVTAVGGQQYELSLRNSPDACGFSFFSDERGVIYQGGVIDCSVELKPAS